MYNIYKYLNIFLPSIHLCVNYRYKKFNICVRKIENTLFKSLITSIYFIILFKKEPMLQSKKTYA